MSIYETDAFQFNLLWVSPLSNKITVGNILNTHNTLKLDIEQPSVIYKILYAWVSLTLFCILLIECATALLITSCFYYSH